MVLGWLAYVYHSGTTGMAVVEFSVRSRRVGGHDGQRLLRDSRCASTWASTVVANKIGNNHFGPRFRFLGVM